MAHDDSTPPPHAGAMFRLWWIPALLMPAALLFLAIQPVHSTAVVLAMVLLWLGAGAWLAVLARRRAWRWVAAALILAPLVPLASPRAIDRTALADGYLARLRAYEGTTYLWGGEGGLGIDCSGLPRRAMLGALLAQAYGRASGPALAAAGDLLWHDASARTMLAGYGGRMRAIGGERRLNQQQGDAQPGDVVITTNGIHAMVHLDAATIIQAEPGAGWVIVERLPTDSPWYEQPAQVLRWRLLD
jgi:hypothetical protein